ncbi:hypothetical protein BLNAU_15811 [Blattamonas nauphoetae]|uniref:Uncharacterized protein n=1 Tax=Blattamonas nauphoetae TaxID=2049346 RepID=A0ABQ9X9J6_9EUKA|nr:hypothetical protein BLNAU_15811 [Blattamonas nauphoetae]
MDLAGRVVQQLDIAAALSCCSEQFAVLVAVAVSPPAILRILHSTHTSHADTGLSRRSDAGRVWESSVWVRGDEWRRRTGTTGSAVDDEGILGSSDPSIPLSLLLTRQLEQSAPSPPISSHGSGIGYWIVSETTPISSTLHNCELHSAADE